MVEAVTSRQAPAAAHSSGRGVGVLAFACLSGVGAVGAASNLQLLVFAAAISAALLLAVVMPESVLALFLFAPAIKLTPALGAIPIDLTLLGAMGVVFVIGVRLFQGEEFPVPGAAVAAIALAALILASVVWSPDPSLGLDKALRFEVLTLLAFLAPFALIRTRRAFTRLFVALVALSLFTALTASATGEGGGPLSTIGGNHIELARHAAIGLVILVAYFIPSGRIFVRVALAVSAGVLALTVLQSGSRGVLAAVIAALAFALAANARDLGTAIIRFGGGLLVLSVSLLTLGPVLAPEAWAKYEANLFESNSTAVFGLRAYLARTAVELGWEHPLGLGSSGFPWVTRLNYPHNIFLELWVEFGVVAVVLFCALLVAASRAFVRAAATQSREAALVGALTLLFLLSAQFSSDINGNRLVWFSLGLMLALPLLRDGPSQEASAAVPLRVAATLVRSV